MCFFFPIICFVLHVEIFSFAGQILATVVHVHICSCFALMFDVSPVKGICPFNLYGCRFLFCYFGWISENGFW